jgi:hypothetical protein
MVEFVVPKESDLVGLLLARCSNGSVPFLLLARLVLVEWEKQRRAGFYRREADIGNPAPTSAQSRAPTSVRRMNDVASAAYVSIVAANFLRFLRFFL